jgi:hypothetical protein
MSPVAETSASEDNVAKIVVLVSVFALLIGGGYFAYRFFSRAKK